MTLGKIVVMQTVGSCTMTLIGLSDGIAPSAIAARRRAPADASHRLGWSGADTGTRTLT